MVTLRLGRNVLQCAVWDEGNNLMSFLQTCSSGTLEWYAKLWKGTCFSLIELRNKLEYTRRRKFAIKEMNKCNSAYSAWLNFKYAGLRDFK